MNIVECQDYPEQVSEKIKIRRWEGQYFGITPENVNDYLPYIDYFLVATGIGKSFSELDEAKTRQLVHEVRNFEAN